MKFYTPVEVSALPVGLTPGEKVMTLGSCFSDSMAGHLRDAGFDVCANPFGTLYNPASICSAVMRLDSGSRFVHEDCVRMGAGAGMICSFEHHTAMARRTESEFLEAANAALGETSAFWKVCRKIIISLGTSFVWRHKVPENGSFNINDCISGDKTELCSVLTILLGTNNHNKVVSNCLKIPEKEFSHEMLKYDEISSLLNWLVTAHPDKEFIFTVSPIRHLAQGAWQNSLSKSALQLGVADVCANHPGRACSFPAYEILCDELRDYRFYADDLVHPSGVAIDYIWEKFCDAAIPSDQIETVRQNEKAARRAAHRPILK